ncbi:hypothetical protein SVIOM74S_00477 [Streptomyces violarus]
MISVELAGGDVIMRAPSVIPGYEYRTAWSWDDRQRAMLATRDEILRALDRRKDTEADDRPLVGRRRPSGVPLGVRPMRRRRFRSPAWAASLTWKSAVFLTVMCCTLAALLGVLVHTAVTRQAVSHAREKALGRLEASPTRTRRGSRCPGARASTRRACPARCARWRRAVRRPR